MTTTDTRARKARTPKAQLQALFAQGSVFPEGSVFPQGKDGVLIGEVRSVAPLHVDYPGNPGARPRPALATVAIRAEDVGRRVVLSFVDGNAQRPVVLGFLQTAPGVPAAVETAPIETRVDGNRVVLTGRDRVELRCGEASIVLTRDGKVSIHGVSVTSQAKRANKIRGGSIQLN